MDLVIRATVVFFFILLITRVAGRREVGELEPFDLILLVVVGDLVQQGVTQNDQSVTGALVVISTIVLLTMFVSWATFHIPRLRRVTQGVPIVLVKDGRTIDRNMRRERITIDDLLEEVRQNQMTSIGELQWAILEDDGRVSCIPRKQD
jgi:uncharacterized membrane protein YcaP (DUF421 family)